MEAETGAEALGSVEVEAVKDQSLWVWDQQFEGLGKSVPLSFGFYGALSGWVTAYTFSLRGMGWRFYCPGIIFGTAIALMLGLRTRQWLRSLGFLLCSVLGWTAAVFGFAWLLMVLDGKDYEQKFGETMMFAIFIGAMGLCGLVGAGLTAVHSFAQRRGWSHWRTLGLCMLGGGIAASVGQSIDFVMEEKLNWYSDSGDPFLFVFVMWQAVFAYCYTYRMCFESMRPEREWSKAHDLGLQRNRG